MTPQKFRKAIDDSWPVEIRFMAQQILQSWEEQIIERDDLLRQMKEKMNGGPWSRLRAKGWRSLTDRADALLPDIEGAGTFLAEEENHETQTGHAETDRQDQQRASS